jgi:osmotically-inducible protein OsmY
VVAVPPLPDLSATDLCLRLRNKASESELPVFVVGTSHRQARRLYQVGASGQFDWPDEQAAFVRAVLRVVGTGTEKRAANARDLALAAKVEERLSAESNTFGSLIKVQVQRGVVVLSGEVDALWKASELERTLSAIPGVQEVAVRQLRVPPSGISDQALVSAVRAVLRSVSGEKRPTYATRVSNGEVILTGTAESRRELNRIVALLEQVHGVRSIENLATVAPGARGRDRKLAASLSRLATSQFPDSRVRIAAFGRIVVLSGKARNTAERRAIEQMASDHPRVDRVISKIG